MFKCNKETKQAESHWQHLQTVSPFFLPSLEICHIQHPHCCPAALPLPSTTGWVCSLKPQRHFLSLCRTPSRSGKKRLLRNWTTRSRHTHAVCCRTHQRLQFLHSTSDSSPFQWCGLPNVFELQFGTSLLKNYGEGQREWQGEASFSFKFPYPSLSFWLLFWAALFLNSSAKYPFLFTQAPSWVFSWQNSVRLSRKPTTYLGKNQFKIITSCMVQSPVDRYLTTFPPLVLLPAILFSWAWLG